MKGFDSATGSRGKSARMSDFADCVVWPEGDYKAYRLIGPVYSVCYYWFTIATERKPDGVSIPKQCLDHDGLTDTYVTDVCPYRASGLGRESKEYFINAIDREEQEGRDYPRLRIRPEEYMEHNGIWLRAGDSRKTPCRLLGIPDSQIDKLKGFKKLNKVRKRDGTVVGMDISDERFGCDINILFDPNKKGPARYDIQKGDRTPLTEEEMRYGLYRADLLKPGRLEEAKREMEDLASKIVKRKPKDGEKGERGAAPRSRREVDDPLMEDASVRLREDDLEDRPRRSRSRDEEEPRRARRSREDEDERPRRSRSRDEEEDLGLDEDFEQPRRRASREDEDERPRRSRSRDEEDEPRRARRSRDEDDDEDDRPRRRRPRIEEDEIPY